MTLSWQGYVDLKDGRVTQLVMTAEGDERLRWGNAALKFQSEPDVRAT